MHDWILVGLIGFSGLSTAENLELAKADGDQEVWNYSQAVDPADGTRRFRQRLFADRTFDSGRNAPIILELCGEWECSAYHSPLTARAAQEQRALILRIEHRYYGLSQPFADLSVENLRHLKMANAILDVEAILSDIRREWGRTGPIIAMGCSYAGNLAAFLRSRRPDLIAGAVAVSAPVRFQTFIPEKDVATARRLGVECAQKARLSVREFEQRMSKLDPLSFQVELRRFGFQRNDISWDSFLDLLGDFPSAIAGQSNFRDFCSELDAGELGSLEKWFTHFVKVHDPETDTLEVAEQWKEIPSSRSVRQWLYQTCTEFGFFQITDPERGVGPLGKDADSKRRMCQRLFKIEALPDVAHFMAHYFHPLVETSSRVIFTNSNQDFWSLFSIRPGDSRDSDLLSVMTEEGRHCSAMRDFDKKGQPGVLAGAALSAIHEWVRSPSLLSNSAVD